MFPLGHGIARHKTAKTAATPRSDGPAQPWCGFRRFALVWIVAFLALLVVACGITKAPKALMLRTRSLAGGKVDVRVLVDPQANQNSAVAVDLLFVYNEDLLGRLVQLTAAQWFAQREQIRRDFLPGQGADVWSWEWIPGQKIPVQQLPIKPSAVAGLVFADYRTPGNHRFRIDPSEDIVIQLGVQDLTVDTEAGLEERVAKAKADKAVPVEMDKDFPTKPAIPVKMPEVKMPEGKIPIEASQMPLKTE